jgi:hypothetical protein
MRSRGSITRMSYSAAPVLNRVGTAPNTAVRIASPTSDTLKPSAVARSRSTSIDSSGLRSSRAISRFCSPGDALQPIDDRLPGGIERLEIVADHADRDVGVGQAGADARQPRRADERARQRNLQRRERASPRAPQASPASRDACRGHELHIWRAPVPIAAR